MSYDIFFVRRDPGHSFEDALDELEGSFRNGDPGELSDADLEQWDALLPLAAEILGALDVDDEDDSGRGLVGRTTGVELTMIAGEIEIHVPDDRRDIDSVELMSTVYDLARAVEDVTGLEGYDPQVGEPVSARLNDDAPTRRRWPDDAPDDDENRDAAGRGSAGRSGPSRPHRQDEMQPGPVAARRPERRWWEVWKS